MHNSRCKVRKHQDDCLCDVVVKEPAPINFGFTDVWHADIVAKAVGYKEGNEGAALADFLEALGSAYEATRVVAAQDEDWLEGTHDTAYRAKIVKLLRSGESIIDLPDVLCDSFAHIIACLTRGRPCIVWSWPEATWATLEDAMRATEVSPTTLAKTFNVTYSQAESFVEWYGRAKVVSPRKQTTARAAQLFEQHRDEPIKIIFDTMIAEGFNVNLNQIYRLRSRWRQHN